MANPPFGKWHLDVIKLPADEPQQRRSHAAVAALPPPEINDPPFGRWEIVVIQYQTPEYQQRRRFAPIEPATVNDPPFGSTKLHLQPVALYKSDHSVIWMNGYAAVEGPDPAADNPPFGIRPWLSTAIESWTEPQPDPVKRNVFTESGLVPPADEPPLRNFSVAQATIVENWNSTLVPLWATGPVTHIADNPPFSGLGLWFETVIDSWQDEEYRLPPRNFIDTSGPVSPSDEPPYSQRWSWHSEAFENWVPEYREPQRSFPVPQEPPSIPVNNPPFNRRSFESTFIDAWEPWLPQPQAGRSLPQPSAAASAVAAKMYHQRFHNEAS